MSMVGRRNVTNTLFEWQIDSLTAAANDNAQLEGEELSRAASDATTRATAMCQISFKDATVTGTQRTVSHAGTNDMLAYQMTKRSKELKRDIETMALINNIAVTGNATTARETGGLGAWLSSNVSRGTNGTSGSLGTTAATDGTQRALAESYVETVAQSIYTNGGEAGAIMVGAFNKTKVSDFTGRANSRHMVDENAVANNVTVYDSDFGNFKVVINRFQRERDGWLIDPEYARLAFLRNFQVTEIAKVGDADTRMILAEWGLQVDNEAAHGIVADLTTS